MRVVVTGASKGIGLEMVKLFSADANNMVYAVTRSEENFAKLQSVGSNVIPVVQDLTQNDLKNFKHTFTSVPHIDILINNAGTLVKKPFFQISDEEWEELFDVNFFSIVRMIRYLLPIMGQKHSTHIVNIGSIGGFQGSKKFPGLTAYSASKSALSGLTETLAEELSSQNIKVNCLALGAVQTKMFESAFPDLVAPNSPLEMAQFIHDFSISGYKFFNGKTLPVSTSTP
jgi:NAD(P)-dependent dehydrogenase (short-subunit alcohol dehydrogenase family)